MKQEAISIFKIHKYINLLKKCKINIGKDTHEIDKLDLSVRAYNLLVSKHEVTTIDEILNISLDNTRRYSLNADTKSGREIIDKIHSLGLKFSDERKNEIILNENSSIDDLFYVLGEHKSILSYNIMYRYSIKTIGELLKLDINIPSSRKENNIYNIPGFGESRVKELIDKVHSLGFIFDCEKNKKEEIVEEKNEIKAVKESKKDIKLTGESTIEELFETMFFNKSVMPARLAEKGVYTVNDLLLLPSKEPSSCKERNIYNIRGFGKESIKKLKDYLHSLGFIFADERTNLNSNMTLDYLFNSMDLEYVSREFYEKILTSDDFAENKFVLMFIKQAEILCINEYGNKYTKKEIIEFLNNKIIDNKKKMLNITNALVKQLKK